MEKVNLAGDIKIIKDKLLKETNELSTVEGNLKRKEDEVRRSEIELKKTQGVHDKLAQEANDLKKKEGELLHSRNELDSEMKKFTKELEELNRTNKKIIEA